MTDTKKKRTTTVNLTRKLLDDVEASGVKNFSAYVERLIKADLYTISERDHEDDAKIKKLQEELARLSREWENLEYSRAREEKKTKVTP